MISPVTLRTQYLTVRGFIIGSITILMMKVSSVQLEFFFADDTPILLLTEDYLLHTTWKRKPILFLNACRSMIQDCQSEEHKRYCNGFLLYCSQIMRQSMRRRPYVG